MDPIVIFLVAAAGALTGIFTGILLLRRKLRPPITEAEHAELKDKLRAGEASLVAAAADAEELRKQLALREKAILQSQEELEKRRKQLDIQLAETQEQKALRSGAEDSIRELGTKIVLLTEQCTKLEAQAKQETQLTAEKANRLVSMEGELEVGRKRIQELIEQLAQLAAESFELKHLHEQEERIRTDLEAQLSAEREKVGRMTGQIAELQSERLQLEVKVQEERGSAAKGMELLMLAQEKLSSAFKGLGVEGQNGCPGQASLEAAAGGAEANLQAEELVQFAAHSS